MSSSHLASMPTTPGQPPTLQMNFLWNSFLPKSEGRESGGRTPSAVLRFHSPLKSLGQPSLSRHQSRFVSKGGGEILQKPFSSACLNASHFAEKPQASCHEQIALTFSVLPRERHPSRVSMNHILRLALFYYHCRARLFSPHKRESNLLPSSTL